MIIKEIRDIETKQLQGYKLDGIFVPLDPSNRHYQEIQKAIKNGIQIKPAFTEEERLIVLKKRTYDRINSVSDMLNNKAYYYISGKKVSKEQIERYKVKYNKAIEAIETNDYSYFELEANLTGMTPEDLANLVREKGDEWEIANANTTKLLEATRVKMSSILKNEINTILKLKLFNKYLDYYSKQEPIFNDIFVTNLFTNFESKLNDLNNGVINENDIDNLEVVIEGV